MENNGTNYRQSSSRSKSNHLVSTAPIIERFISFKKSDIDNSVNYCPDNAIELIHDISCCNSLNYIQSLVTSMSQYFGFSHYTAYAKLGVFNKPRAYMMAQSVNDWMLHYKDRNYLAIDPTIRYASETYQPYTWDLSNYTTDVSNTLYVAERALVEEAIDFGMTQVVNIPVHRGNGDFGVFRFTKYGDSPLNDQDINQILINMLPVISLLFEKQVKLFIAGADTQDRGVSLTFREKDILTLFAHGGSVSSISERFNIAEHTVRNHLKNIRQKLCVTNITHAVVKAYNMGAISF